MRRSSSQDAGQLLRAIVANDDQPVTAHDIAMAAQRTRCLPESAAPASAERRAVATAQPITNVGAPRQTHSLLR
jgi:hypothetical protein